MTNIDNVVEFSVDRGKFYLQESGEFYPFASILKLDGTLIPVGVEPYEDYPDSTEVKNILETNILERIKKKDILAGAVGADVYLKSRKTGNKITAIEVRAIELDSDPLDLYLPYAIVEGELYFQEPIREKGTLK